MVSNSLVKNTLIFFILAFANTTIAKSIELTQNPISQQEQQIVVGAQRFDAYKDKLQGKKVGILTNQTGVITTENNILVSTVDFLLENDVEISKIFAPEHGFRGSADAGELVKDGKDTKTDLPIISLYGSNKKPSKVDLSDIDIMLFDLQDVGARFYTYISSLHYLMEACAELNIPVIILDRPNPNIAIIDGPILEEEHKSFVGMHPIPTLHGMTIGEYGKMINGEKWLPNNLKCELFVVPCLNYDRTKNYSLPIAPSPNLPNDQAINLYPSLCFFEGTNVSSGRGTDLQFQIYGSPYLKEMPYSFTPISKPGAKDPMNKGKLCYGENLSLVEKTTILDLQWLIKAYQSSTEKDKFFNSFFTKLAGTKKLQIQIIEGKTAEQIRNTWQNDLANFKNQRRPYLLY